MAPSYGGSNYRQRPSAVSQSRSAGVQDGVIRSNGPTNRSQNEESWVEISSQPSSSSLSSIGDEIITTGLRVQQDPHARRRRRANAPNLLPRHTSTSSQEEYDESESSSDDVAISNSIEHISSRLQRQSSYDAGFESDSSSENLTAIGTRAAAVEPEPVFTPQPNVFSQPQTQRRTGTEPGSHLPPAAPSRPTYSQRDRYSYSSRNDRIPQSHTPYNTYSPSHQVDHDAALRASLTTLLSCAAAARGLPKRSQPPQTSSQQPTGLRMVPESALLASPPSPTEKGSADNTEKGKRKTPKQDASRAAKKKRTGSMAVVAEEMGLVSPTLLTWIVSAGVVVLVSAIGFSAGYAIGREVGRQEVLGAGGVPAGAFEGSGVGECGREVGRATGGLRRFRLGVAA